MNKTLHTVNHFLDEFMITRTDLAKQFDTSLQNVGHALRGGNKKLLKLIIDYLVNAHNVDRSYFVDYPENELEKIKRVQDKIIRTVAGLQQNQTDIINKLK